MKTRPTETMKLRLLVILGLVGVVCLTNPAALRANSTSICDGISGNLVVNCGFELGVVGGAPALWVVNAGFLLRAGSFNQVVVTPALVNSGNNALQFGNLDSEPAAGIAQLLTDTSGQSYTVNFFMFDSGAPAQNASDFFDAQINGTNKVTLTGVTAPGTYTDFTFSFTGTGSDTLAFLADTNNGFFHVDDVSVVANGAAATPEPSSLLLLGTGLLGLWPLARRRIRSV
jgi:PEP-CTERM motif